MPFLPLFTNGFNACNISNAEAMANLFTPDGSYEDFAFQIEAKTQQGVAMWVSITGQSIPDAQLKIIDVVESESSIVVKSIF